MSHTTPTNISELKTNLAAEIKNDPPQKISGNILQTDLNDMIDVLSANSRITTGLYTCSTAAATATKAVTIPDYVMEAGGAFKVKFTYANSAANPVLKINTENSKAIVFNGAVASATNTWGAGEVVEFYYDPTYNSNAGGFIGKSTVVSVSQNTLTIGGTPTDIKVVNVEEETLKIGNEDKGELFATKENPEWLSVFLDSAKKILEGYKQDGKHINTNVIVEKLLRVNNVVDNEGRTLSKNDFTDNDKNTLDFFKSVTNPLFFDIVTDLENKILEAITKEGKKVFYIPVLLSNGTEFSKKDNPEWLEIAVDEEGHIIEGTKRSGKYISNCLFRNITTTDIHILNTLNLSDSVREQLQLEIGSNEGNWVVPQYYYDNDYLKNKTKEISELIRKNIINGDAFFFVTDTHWELNQKHSPAIIKVINRLLNVPRLFHGGDIYHVGLSYDGYNIGCINAFRNALITPKLMYCSDGNHEYIKYNNIAAKYGDVFAETRIFLDDVVFGGENKNYYYVDNKQKKIRYINLYSWGEIIDFEHSIYVNGLEDAAQMVWLQDVALNVESEWQIIIFIHGVAWYSPIYDEINHAQGYQNLYDVINNYSGDGEILGIIAGHAHTDLVTFEGGDFPVIVTTSDFWYPIEYTYVDEHGQTQTYVEYSDLIEKRVNGTITEQAFDTVIYDKDNGIFNFVRIGSRAMNRSDSFGGNAQVDCRSIFIKPIAVGDSLELSTFFLSGDVSWNSADTSIITVSSDGIIQAQATGNTVITAICSNGEKQAFFIRVI